MTAAFAGADSACNVIGTELALTAYALPVVNVTDAEPAFGQATLGRRGFGLRLTGRGLTFAFATLTGRSGDTASGRPEPDEPGGRHADDNPATSTHETTAATTARNRPQRTTDKLIPAHPHHTPHPRGATDHAGNRPGG